jgi:NAD(P)-dependent dehydrogenase (short-subunit alcohol dehydrogenase family)
VTGASRGIGAAVARALAEAGAHVAVSGRDEAALATTAEDVRGWGTHVEELVADVTDVAACRSLVKATVARFGRLDLVVHAAGGTLRGPALDLTEQDWDAIQTLNLKSSFFLAQAAAKVMVEQEGGGSIVMVGSLNGVVGNAWAASYAASKGGIVQLTKSLALEWAGQGIRVNAIGPGMIATEMTEPLTRDPDRYSALLAHIPMGRFGQPDELGGAAVYLASDASRYMTGQVVYVDGGYLCV